MSQQVFDRFYPVAPSLGSFDKFSLVSYRIFKGPATRIARSMPLLRDDLLRSNLRFTPVGLVSVALFATLISGLASLGVIVWASRTPYSFLYLVALVPPGVYLTTMNAPKISKSGRAASLENELPFVLGYMSILAGGGLSLIDSLREIANLDIFSSASKEAKRILIDIDVFGHDPVTALDRAAKYSPSREWGDLLAGYTTVLRTGGDHINFLALHLKETFEKMTEKLKRTVDTTGLVAESFLIVTVVLGMVLFTLYLVEAIINNNPGGLSNIIFFSYLVVPALSAVFIWLMDVFAPKWPYTDMRPYKIFLVFIPVGALVFFTPMPFLKFYQHMAISLLAISTVPSYFAIKYSRERRGIERMLPEFIEDVAAQRKIGLPPEESIERLGEKNSYGNFSKYVVKMAGQLSWGISLRKVIGTFSKDVNSWIAKAIGTLMLEVVEIGGGTLKGFDDMATFTRKVSTTESDTRSAFRPYVMIIYVGGLMLTLTTFMMINILAQQAALQAKGLSQAVTAPKGSTLDLLVGASVFQCWVLGLVAGKMGEGSLSEGFKHSVILVLLTVAAVFIVGWFIPLNL